MTQYLKNRPLLTEAVLLALILAVILAVGVHTLAGERFFLGVGSSCNYLMQVLSPSAMLALGQGLVMPDMASNAEMAAFFDIRQAHETLDTAALAGLETGPVTVWHGWHYYLLYSIGAAWSVFGISWHVYRGLILFFYLLTAVAAYALFRQAMGRILSALATLVFVASPSVLFILPNLRDFAKAPFFLFAMLWLLLIVVRRRGAGRFMGLAFLLGLTMGIGQGFRPDFLILLPISVFVLLFADVRARRWRRRILLRATAIAIFLVTFVASAWPPLEEYRQSGESYHNVMVGFASVNNRPLGIRPGSYEFVSSYLDSFVSATRQSYGERVCGFSDRDAPLGRETGNAFILDVATTFPADMLTRAYAAVLWVLNGYSLDYHRGKQIHHLPLGGIWYAAAALLILSRRSLARAGWLFALLLFFSGYVSLQFHYRHCFHLGVIPLLVAGFLLNQAWRLCSASTDARRAAFRSVLPPWQSAAGFRMLVFAAGAALVLVAPLAAARAYQHLRLDSAKESYAKAELEAYEVDTRTRQDWVLFRPKNHILKWYWEDNPRNRIHQEEYLAVRLRPRAEKRRLWVRYAETGGHVEFTTLLDLHPTGTEKEGSDLFFFAVYESADPVDGGWCQMLEVGLHEAFADDFLGLYRVTNIEDYPLLLTLLLPAKKGDFVSAQRLGGLGAGHYERYEGALPEETTQPFYPESDGLVYRLYFESDWERLAKVCDELVEAEPLEISRHLYRIEALRRLGRQQAAIDACTQAIDASPNLLYPYLVLDELLDEQDKPQQTRALWQSLSERHADFPFAHRYLALAWASAGERAKTLAALSKGLAAEPDNPEFQTLLMRIRLADGDIEKAAGLARSLWPHYPQAAAEFVDAAFAAMGAAARDGRTQDIERIQQACATVLSAGPRVRQAFDLALSGDVEGMARLLHALRQDEDQVAPELTQYLLPAAYGHLLLGALDTGLALVDAVAREDIEGRGRMAALLAKTAQEALESGAPKRAASLFLGAAGLEQDEPEHLFQAGAASLAANEPEEALGPFKTLMRRWTERQSAMNGVIARYTAERETAERWDDAVRYRQLALEFQAGQPRAHYALACAYLHSADSIAPEGKAALAAAQPQFQRALGIDAAFGPPMANLLLASAAKLRAQDKHEAALARLRMGAELTSASAPLHLALGCALVDAGNTSEGLAALEHAAGLDPAQGHLAAEALLQAGKRVLDRGALDMALELFQYAHYISPDAANNAALASAEAGRRHAQQGRLEAAIEAYEAALSISPDTPAFHVALSEVFASQGEVAEARQACLDAIAVDPASDAAYDRLNTLLAAEKDPSVRQATWRELAKREQARGQPGRAWLHLGLTLAADGERDEASRILDSFVENAGGDAALLVRAAQASLRLGAHEIARKALEPLFEGGAGHEKAVAALLLKATVQAKDFHAARKVIEQCRERGIRVSPRLADEIAWGLSQSTQENEPAAPESGMESNE